MFGIVPGCRYGWPKNVLHWAGIHESVLDICATARPHFVIADAMVAMEGDGPLNGTPKYLKTVLLADDPVAADASLGRLMGCEPTQVAHIREAGRFIGNLHQSVPKLPCICLGRKKVVRRSSFEEWKRDNEKGILGGEPEMHAVGRTN